MREIRKTICPLDCPDTCGLLATIVDGRVVSLNGDPDHPYTKGFICRKMKRYPERVYAKHRILTPKARVGKKGDGHFRDISWPEAWNILTERLQEITREHGGESILPFHYAGNMGVINNSAGLPFFNRIGTLQTMQTICSAAAKGGWKMVCGKGGGCPPWVAESSDLIILWGINVRVSNVHFWRYVSKARKNGAKLVVIDPYLNETAEHADLFIQVKPGGDSALALGVIKFLANKGAVDQEFIASETEGFNRFAGYVASLEMGELEQISGVGQGTIHKLAELLENNPRSFIRIGVGLTRNSRGGMAIRSIGSLAAVMGLFDGREGRGVLLFSGAFSGDSDHLHFPHLSSAGRRTVNMIHLGRELTTVDPKIRALIVYNANPASVAPDGTSVKKGLSREDMFTVVHEQVMSPTAKYADILLPATTFLENRDLYTSYGHFYMGIADPVIEPVGEAISNFDFFQTLAGKMGFDDDPFQQSLNDRMSLYLSTLQGVPDDFNPDTLEAGSYIESIYNRLDGPVLRRKQSIFQFVIDTPEHPPHACITPTAEFDHPDLVSRFPYRLITPPDDRLLNSTFGEFYQDEIGEVLIHPDDAERDSIVDGSLVTLSNFRGDVQRKARVSDRTGKGLLVAAGIYWPSGERGGINNLTSQECSDVGGGALFHESRVKLEKSTSS